MKLGFSNGENEEWFEGGDFPLAIGISTFGVVDAGPSAEHDPLIWILSHDAGFSVQPEKQNGDVQYNGSPMLAPVRLRVGDQLKISEFTADISSGDDSLVMSIRQPEAPAAILQPDSSQQELQSQRLGRNFNANPDQGSGKRGISKAAKISCLIFLLLSVGTAYVLLASPVNIKVDPEPQSKSLTGFPPPIPVFDRYLVWPGDYVFEAQTEGYRPLKETVSVAFGSRGVFEFSLKKLPGLLNILTPPVEGAEVSIDGAKRGQSPVSDMKVEAGTRQIDVSAQRYFPVSKKIEIRGKGERQSLTLRLTPAWGEVSLDSDPDEAKVSLNGKLIGRTPLKFEPLEGQHELVVTREGYKPLSRQILVKAGSATNLGTVRLEKIDGTLVLKTRPPGATIMVNGQFRGRTPLSFPLISDKPYKLKLAKQGYQNLTRTVRVEGGKTTPLSIRLRPTFGTIFLVTDPPGANLKVNGRGHGSASQRLRLQTVPQVLEVSKSGYIPFKTRVIPRIGTPKKISVRLKTVGDQLKAQAQKGIRTPGGQRLRLIYIQSPATFTIGAPRRQAGRRSNEVQYPVRLTKSFYVSEKEVTNREFKKFRSNHSSGSYRGIGLDDPDQPVVNVSWNDAARYANWLSEKEGLIPAYQEVSKKLVPVSPLTNGYRLPTEAEWEFIARYDGGKRSPRRPLKFPWGAKMPPPARSGNYADDGSQRLPFAIPHYVDGFPVSARVGSFKPNQSQIYDLGGNVAEWCHDFYDVPFGSTKQVKTDPLGPASGRFHVIKGASWRSGSVTELRLSYRDYASKGRNDVGFRVVRHVDTRKK